MKLPPLRLYHGMCGYRCGNAGDVFSADLIRGLYGVPVEVVSEPEVATIFAGGSLLDGVHPNVVPPESTAILWGTGMLSEWSRFAGSARIVAVRGPLTRARCRGAETAVLGDPGLLVSRVWPAAPEKRWRLGIVPHYVDAQDENIAIYARRSPDRVTVIDICSPVRDVLRAISECEYILSSSLHGLVFADSYGVPNAWIRPSDKLQGGSYKFRDYRASLGYHDAMPIPFTSAEPLEEMASAIFAWWIDCGEPALHVASVDRHIAAAKTVGASLFNALRPIVRPDWEEAEEAP